LEVVDEVSEVEVLGWETLVVRDVRNFWHIDIDLRFQLIAGGSGLELKQVAVSMKYFADRR
jgi:hypothetical protein